MAEPRNLLVLFFLSYTTLIFCCSFSFNHLFSFNLSLDLI